MDLATQYKLYPKEIRTKLYTIWASMKSRCLKPQNKRYYCYGARGIKVCDRWLTFSNFLQDMYPSYKKGLSIDRLDNNGNYEPNNCRWATRIQQAQNKSSNHWITFKGVTDTLTHWAQKTGIKETTLHNRLNYYGYSIEEALTKGRGGRLNWI